MRVRLVLAALALLSFSFLAPAAMASGVTLNAVCDTLGASAMNDDHTAILLCAFPASNPATNCGSPSGCVWKPMSGGGGSCYTDSALAPGLPVGSPCMVGGFTVKGSLGMWGYTCYHSSFGYRCHFRPAGGGVCTLCGDLNDNQSIGEAYLCCQN